MSHLFPSQTHSVIRVDFYRQTPSLRKQAQDCCYACCDCVCLRCAVIDSVIVCAVMSVEREGYIIDSEGCH